MHRAGIFDLGRWESQRLGIERHPTFRAGAWPKLPHLGAHRAYVDPRVFSRHACRRNAGGWLVWCRHDQARRTSQRYQSRWHRHRHGLGWGRKDLLGIRLKLRQADSATEEILSLFMERLEAGGCRIYIHAADGVLCLGGELRGVDMVHSFCASSSDGDFSFQIRRLKADSSKLFRHA